MIKRLFFFTFILVGILSCGDDTEQSEEEMETTCEGAVTITVDGVSDAYDTPLSATMVDLPALGGTELLVAWVKNGKALNFQVVINELDLACFPTGRIELKSLPSNISLLGFQYTDINGPISSVSNVFIEDGGDGWIDIKSCDGDNDILSADFEFDAVTLEGELVQIRGGSAKNICFKRTK